MMKKNTKKQGNILVCNYGTLISGGATKLHLAKIDKRVKISMFIMLFKGKYDSLKPFYEDLKILLLSKNIKLLQGKFIWN